MRIQPDSENNIYLLYYIPLGTLLSPGAILKQESGYIQQIYSPNVVFHFELKHLKRYAHGCGGTWFYHFKGRIQERDKMIK